MGLIGSIFRLFGLGFAGDIADNVGADDVIKDKAKDYAKDKAADYAKGKAKSLITGKKSSKSSKAVKDVHEEIDKNDKYWYLKVK